MSNYFSAHLSRRAGAITFVDIERGVAAQGVRMRPELRDALLALYHHADVGRFDEAPHSADSVPSVSQLLHEIGRLEKGWAL